MLETVCDTVRRLYKILNCTLNVIIIIIIIQCNGYRLTGNSVYYTLFRKGEMVEIKAKKEVRV